MAFERFTDQYDDALHESENFDIVCEVPDSAKVRQGVIILIFGGFMPQNSNLVVVSQRRYASSTRLCTA